jgi:predicted sulfurtransferase
MGNNINKNKKKQKQDKVDAAAVTDNDKGGGAHYVDPKMRKSTDFASWVQASADQLKGKRVMMYCTGGVRCERASAFLNHTMGDQLQGVYQLQGGIERYLQTFPEGGFWRGKNFVFDKRESVSAENPNGDGGVLQKQKQHDKKKKNKKEVLVDGVDTKCCLCDKPWDRYVGKRKCETCGVPVLMCDTCLSTRHKHNNNNHDQTKDKDKEGG